MQMPGKKSLRIFYVFGIAFFISSFAYCQESVVKQNNNLSKANSGSKNTTVIAHNADSLQAIISKKFKENVGNIQDSTKTTQNKYSDESLAIGGLVIDHTQSKWGRDFVDLFNKSFDPPQQINDYTIVIEEKPLPQFGTLILMKVNGNYIFQRFIQPRYHTIKVNAEQATGIALQYLANYQQIQKDLQGDDLKGTGIY
jgi:curli production assembly/transport component CsgE